MDADTRPPTEPDDTDGNQDLTADDPNCSDTPKTQATEVASARFVTTCDLAARGESGDGIRAAMHPREPRCSSFKYGRIFSVVAPCHRGASSVSVLAGTFTMGC